VRRKLAVEVLCGARNGRSRCLVARLWWTPEPEQLRFNVDNITVWLLSRDIRGTIPMGCFRHDGNKGQQTVDLHELLWPSFEKYMLTGKKQPPVTLPRQPTR
jgi:hypothetical protein